MARKVGKVIAGGNRRWLISVYLGCDRETRDLGRDVKGAKITFSDYLDRGIRG